MPKLRFYKTSTKLSLDKIGVVLGGYTIDKLCEEHNGSTELNPHLNCIQELIIDSKDYPCAMLRPWGYVSTKETVLGQYPERTIFFYKRFVETFEHMRKQFNSAKEGQRWLWHCGCVIRKYKLEELEELCLNPWYPWIGEYEPAVYVKEQHIQDRKKTGTAEDIASVLRDAGILNDDGYERAVACIKFHRNNKTKL